MPRILRHPTAEYAGYFLYMAFWSWLGVLSVLFTADRRPELAVPVGGVMAGLQYIGFALMGKSWAKGLLWVAGDMVGGALGFYVP